MERPDHHRLRHRWGYPHDNVHHNDALPVPTETTTLTTTTLPSTTTTTPTITNPVPAPSSQVPPTVSDEAKSLTQSAERWLSLAALVVAPTSLITGLCYFFGLLSIRTG